MQAPFTGEERRTLLDRYFAEHRQWLDLDFRSATSGGSAGMPASPEKDRLAASLAGLLDQYRRGLPVLPLSRCPFSQQVLYHSLDPYGLDGPWWNYTAPVRPLTYLAPTFHSLAGALTLKGSPEKAPFLCVPGPGVPYVVPELLQNNHIRAVISRIPVGKHEGHLVAYFTDAPEARIPRLNTWGANRWELLDRRGTYMWGESSLPESRLDFDLVRWMEEEKLLWIFPGDRTLGLRSGVKDCPYLAAEGTRRIQRIWNGRVLDTGEKEGT